MRLTLWSWAALLTAPLLGFITGSGEAQTFPGGIPLTATSRSGQFRIYGGREVFPGNPQFSSTRIVLVPSLTVVSCERIKAALLVQLKMQDQWQGHVGLFIVPAQQTPSFDLKVVPFGGGWQYQLQVPDRVETRQFVQALVRTLLLEMANRAATERSCEVPYWLAEGLTDEILATSSVDLVVDSPSPAQSLFPNRSRERMISARESDFHAILPLAEARLCLQTNPPLNIEELSWPGFGLELGLDSAAFRASAQLFVHELLRLPGGPAALQAFIAGLPAHFNWQTTFLQTFSVHFDSLRSLEKWWLLQTAHFISRTTFERWDVLASWQRLDEALLASAQTHATSNALPVRNSLSLQTAIQEWAPASQQSLLLAKIQTLDFLRSRLATNAIPLADQYRAALQTHLLALNKPEASLPRSAVAHLSLKSLARATSRRLDALDVRRRDEEAMAMEAALGARRNDASAAIGSGRVP